MNRTSTPQWSPMVSGTEDEFANFLDFGDLSFPPVGDPSSAPASIAGGEILQDAGANGMDASMEGPSGEGILGPGIAQMEEPEQLSTMNDFQDAFSELDASAGYLNHAQQQQQQHQQPQHPFHLQNSRYYGHNPVPPTPSSLDLRGNHAEYYSSHADRQQQILYEHYRRQQSEQMNFTPLVSPAVTPLDTEFQNPDFMPPVDSFSPLTSPALRAQNHALHQSLYGGVRGSDTSDTTSPIDPSLETSAPTSSGTTPSVLRKSKRTTSSGSSKGPNRAVRQSPVVKPQSRRKQPSSTVIPPKEVAGLLEQAHKSKSITPIGADGRLPIPGVQDSSEPDSVSPEPLSEILMPPPATPKSNSASRSPILDAKQGGKEQANANVRDKGAPATPASLMKIRKQAGKTSGLLRSKINLKEQNVAAEAEMEQIMEDIQVPEPPTSSKKPSVGSISAEGANANPTSSSDRTPTGPKPSIKASGSSFPSLTASVLASPNGTSVNNLSDQPKLKIRDSKKRNSTSNQISPALRPKISPSIKPLLPDGAVVSAETSALLLASKSNYQNILEGTHLPGVSYPETLSTNLTSKRTSHKIAEQGRRNRINTALQEIAALLPPQTPPANGQASNSAQTLLTTGSVAQQNNSKASTVEQAIDYIKILQSELKSVRAKLYEVEGKQVNGESREKSAERTSRSSTIEAREAES